MHITAIYKFTFILTLLFNTAISQAQNWQALDWRKKINEDDITISTAKVQGSPYVAVKTEMQIKASLSQLTALAIDASRCKEWVDGCSSSNIYQKISDIEYYQYFISKPPWPLKKRDFLLHVIIKQDENLKVSIQATADNTRYPEQDNIVRIKKTDSLWEFVPLDNGEVKINNYAHVEPTGKIPTWLSNTVLTNTPLNTFRNMYAIISSDTYMPEPLAFIKDNI